MTAEVVPIRLEDLNPARLVDAALNDDFVPASSHKTHNSSEPRQEALQHLSASFGPTKV